MLVLLFATLLLVFIAFYLKRLHKYKVLDDYPGPSVLETITFMTLSNSTDASYKYLLFLTEKYGPVVKIWIKPFRPILLVADPKFMKSILMSKEHINKTEMFKLLKALLGDGLPVISDGRVWKQERKTFAYMLTNQFIADYTSTFKNHVVKLTNSIRMNLNKPVNCQQLLLRHGLNIIFELLTTEDISEQDQRVNKFITAMKNIFHVVFDRMNSLYKTNEVLFKLTKNYNLFVKSSIETKEFVETTFKRMYELKTKTGNKSQQKDFLDLLMATGLSYERMLENLRTFLVGGSDTISSCIAFTLYELAKRPEMQKRIYDEYISILGDDKNNFAEFRDIQKMIYTECVIKESLRIHPVVPMIHRQLAAPAEIDGKIFPDGMDVIFSIITSHNINFENPEEFDPERFLPENVEKLPPHGYFPFSLGPRDCIGKLIGVVECKFLLSYIIRNFTLHPVENHKLDLVGEIVLISKTGIPVIFRERIN